jgi:hypothetical protein
MSCNQLTKPFLLYLIPPDVLLLHLLLPFINYIFYIVGLSCTETWSVALKTECVLQIMCGWRETCVRWPWSCITHCHLNWKYWIWWVPFFSVANVMLQNVVMVWIPVVWWCTCIGLYCGASLPFVLFWSCTVWFLTLFVDEEGLTSRLLWKWIQRLCRRKSHVVSRHFLNNHKC